MYGTYGIYGGFGVYGTGWRHNGGKNALFETHR